MLAWGFILLGSLAWLGSAHPIESDVEPQWLVRERRSPVAARTMILIRGQPSGDGYNYERPGRAFNPQAAMAAYATGGSVATGSIYGSPPKKHECDETHKVVESQTEREEPKIAEEPAQEPEVPAVVETTKTPAVPERKPKASKAPKRRPVKDEDEDDDGGSVYRNFFPMTFAAMSRSRDAEGGEGAGEGGRGPVTAIANSFSKGRGAIATSSAVAYASPDNSQSKQNQPSRYRVRA